MNLGGKLLNLQTPVIMGIINLTPDSFYAGSRVTKENAILSRCETLLSEGAGIIDIGAYSSRPGAVNISAKEELSRLVPALKAIRKQFTDAVLSVDTFRADIAQNVVKNFGVQMINDISAGELDPAMIETMASLQVPYVAMHMKGNPETMQHQTKYAELMTDLISYFAAKITTLQRWGIHDIIIDPGFGFSKTIEQNYHLLSHLEEFRIFEIPVLIGLSRKSMIYKLLKTQAEQAFTGSIVLNTLALLKGADILRVHDVKETFEIIRLVNAYNNAY